MAIQRTDVFDNRIEKTTALIAKLADRAAVLPIADKDLFAEALEELRTSFEELLVAGEELTQQAEELAASRLIAEEGRRKYLELFDQAPDAYLVTDDQGLIVEANERAGRLLGVKPASLLRKPLVVYIDRTDRQAFFGKLAGLKTRERLQDWEVSFRPRKGPAFPGYVAVTPLPGSKEGPGGFRWLVRDATELKKGDAQARMATFPELNPEPIVEVDTSGHIYYINGAAKRILRDLPEKGLGHPWIAGLPEAAEKLRRSNRKPVSREVAVGGRWFLQSISSPDNTGRLRIYGRDITKRKAAEDRLRQYQSRLEDEVRERTADLLRSSELLERVFASVDVAIAYLNPDFDFLRVNRAFADAFGQTPSWYRGKNLFTLHPDPSTREIFRRVLETGEPHMAIDSPFLKEGALKGMLWDWSVLRVGAGEVTDGVVLSLVDVTPRIKAEEEERRLSAAIEQSAEAVVITDAADRILYVNRTFGDLHGLPRPEAIGRVYGEILRFDKEDEAFLSRLRQARETGEIWKGRLTRPRAGQPDLKLDVTISPVRDPSGRIVNYAILERDATKEHRLETAVRNLQKLEALGALAAGIAHDFNNILAPIVINAELAAFEVDRDGPITRSLKLILESASRGRELVRQIIAFSRPTEQKRDVVDLVEVVKETVRFLRASIPQSIAIVESYDAGSGRVRADPTQITQVLMNLGTNAAYAMRERGGRLTIGLSDVVVGPEMETQNPELPPGRYVKMTVEDTGSGVPPEIQDRIFDPFFTTKRRGEGTGMGLAVVRGIVKSHGGAIMVSSAPGRGTTFEVYLPEAKGRIAARRPPLEAPLKGKGRILFVDDEDMLVRSVKPMLERLGYTVTATTDPAAALTTFRASPEAFDLVITDETMPGLTGEKLAREMLRIRPGLPVILSTGFSESIREEDLPAVGIRGFIMKPFSMSEIAEKIRDALKKT